MDDLTEIAEDLCRFYADRLAQIDQLETLDQCELLLCASDLGVETAAVGGVVARLVAEDEAPETGTRPLLHSALMQLVFARLDAGREQRRRFIEYWVNQGHLRGQSVFLVSAIINIALLNGEFLSPASKEYVFGWHLRHADLKSDKLAAWAPFCLRLAGHPDQAKLRADQVLSRRQKDGSWGHELKRTVACAYALGLAQVVGAAEFEPTLCYIASKYSLGVMTELPVRAQTIKLLHLLQRITPAVLHRLRVRLERSNKIFVSYSRKDLNLADRFAEGLKALGFEVWMDRTGISAGEEFVGKLTDAINRCDAVLMLVSQNFVQSEYCLKEILFARKKLKPLLVAHLDDSCLPDSLEFMLGDVQRVNITSESGIQESLAAISAGIKKTVTPKRQE